MDRSRSKHRPADAQTPRTPAIGIDAVTSDATADAIVDTVTSVAQHDTPLLVAATRNTPTLHRQLDDTPAELIEVSDPETDPTHAFAAAGKERGLPGVVLHPAPGSDAVFEYKESLQTFQTSTQYVVEGHATDPATTPSRVGILLASDHSPAAITQLRTDAAPYLDELLVVTDDDTDPVDASQFGLPVERVSCDAQNSASAVAAAITHVTRSYMHCDAVTLLGADTATVTDSVAVLPELIDPLTDGDADLVVGRQLDAPPDADTAGSDSRLRDVIRSAFGGDDTPRSSTELDDGPVAFTPTTARELDRRLNQPATRLDLINTAIRTDQTVRIHEYTPGDTNTTQNENTTPATGPTAAQTTSHSNITAPDGTTDTPASPPSTASSASTSQSPRGARNVHDDHLNAGPRAASNRTLDVVYVAGTDNSDPGVPLDTVRNTVTNLPADTELTVTDARTDVLTHIVDATHEGVATFLVTPRERSRDVDAIADTFGLGVLPLPTTDPSETELTDTLRTHLNQHPDSQLIIAPATLQQDAAASRILAPAADADANATPTSGDSPPAEQQATVLVGIPAYNEAASIDDVVRNASQYADEVLVVDDASNDDTANRAAAAGAAVIQHEDNRGYGGALNTVFAEAARRDPAHLVIVDGDGQHDPSDIPDAVAAQEDSEADIVIGSRFETGSETDLPAYRRVGLAVVNTLTNLSMGVIRRESWVNDTQSGFRTYSRTAIHSLHHDDTIGDGMSASTDILYHAHQHDYDLEEIGTTINYDVEDPSSHNPVTHGLTLVANILKTIEHDRPVTSLGVPGFLSAFAGLGFGYWTFSNYIATGQFPLGLAVTSSFFGLAGIFACFTAIILHSLNTHLTDA